MRWRSSARIGIVYTKEEGIGIRSRKEKVYHKMFILQVILIPHVKRNKSMDDDLQSRDPADI